MFSAVVNVTQTKTDNYMKKKRKTIDILINLFYDLFHLFHRWIIFLVIHVQLLKAVRLYNLTVLLCNILEYVCTLGLENVQ